MRWESTAVTDRGLIRPNNEDSFLDEAEHGIFAVADGMGGHAAGEVASRMAVDALKAEIDSIASAARNPAEPLARAIAAANEAIRRRGHAETDKRGMGTTLSVLLIVPADARGVIAHVGDSRVYRLRAGRLEQLTTDHTWVQERVEAGVLTPEQARDHPYSSILTRVLGADDAVVPDVLAVDTAPGDLFLLCSDGLSGMVPDSELEQILNDDLSLQVQAGRLMDAARDGGAFDNVTFVLVRALPD